MSTQPLDYITLNKANWDERAPTHAASEEYNFGEYQTNPDFIGDVVAFDKPLLGDISGLNVVHLQCHIGTDSLCLARLGARAVTGLDFSSVSLTEARRLADVTKGSGGEKMSFVNSTVTEALDLLPSDTFDLVYTGIGALCWLRKIREWAVVVAGLLRPGGRLFVRECHPVLWSMNYADEGSNLTIEHSYFERDEPVIYDDPGTYVTGPDDSELKFAASKTVEFNHGIGEIVQALLDMGMRVTGLTEHDSIPWNALNGKMTKLPNGEWRLTDRPWRLPHTYTLQAVKE